MTGPLAEITALQYSVTTQRGKKERITQRHSHFNIWQAYNAKFLRHYLDPMGQITEYVGILGKETEVLSHGNSPQRVAMIWDQGTNSVSTNYMKTITIFQISTAFKSLKIKL